jgi:hypothetical protein
MGQYGFLVKENNSILVPEVRFHYINRDVLAPVDKLKAIYGIPQIHQIVR